MRAFRIDIIAEIGMVRRNGPLPLAADAFERICLLWQEARNGDPRLGGIGPLQAANTNCQQRRNLQGPT